MTDRFLTTPTEVSVTCTRLPGRETNLARCEMAHASGGFVPPGDDRLGRYVNFALRLVAEVIERMARPR